MLATKTSLESSTCKAGRGFQQYKSTVEHIGSWKARDPVPGAVCLAARSGKCKTECRLPSHTLWESGISASLLLV
jgi:hypothetical protein